MLRPFVSERSDLRREAAPKGRCYRRRNFQRVAICGNYARKRSSRSSRRRDKEKKNRARHAHVIRYASRDCTSVRREIRERESYLTAGFARYSRCDEPFARPLGFLQADLPIVSAYEICLTCIFCGIYRSADRAAFVSYVRLSWPTRVFGKIIKAPPTPLAVRCRKKRSHLSVVSS